jgi:hypothetical protein
MIDDLKKTRQTSKLPALETKLPRTFGANFAMLNDAESRQLLHQCAIRVLEHFGIHRDLRLPERLAAVGDPITKKHVMNWFAEYSQIEFSEGTGKPSLNRSKAHKLGEGIETPYWKLLRKKRQSCGEFDFVTELDAFLRRSRKKVATGTTEKVLLEQIDRLLKRRRSTDTLL